VTVRGRGGHASAFDDAVIADGITLYAELALRRLEAGA